MKKIFTSLFLILCVASSIFAQGVVWNVDPVHSNVEFTVVHMLISEVTGRFKDFSITVIQPNNDFTDSKVDVAVRTASVSTDNDMRDNHLRSADFFDVANFPEMTFKSTSFEKTDDDTYKITGNLTLHGITKNITLQAKYMGQIKDQQGKTYAGFKASGSINRYDFGLKWNRAIEAGGVAVSDKVDLAFNVKLVR